MIEFKTLKQNMEGDTSAEDAELTSIANEGWEILNIAILDRNNDYSMLRVITLKRETAAPTQASNRRMELLPILDEYAMYLRQGVTTPTVQGKLSLIREEILQFADSQPPTLPADVVAAFHVAHKAALGNDIEASRKADERIYFVLRGHLISGVQS